MRSARISIRLECSMKDEPHFEEFVRSMIEHCLTEINHSAYDGDGTYGGPSLRSLRATYVGP